MREYIVFVGAALVLLGSGNYIINTLKGRTKPNRVSWLIWGVSPVIGTVAALSDGAGWAILPAFMGGLCPLLIFTASFFNKNAYWKLSVLDWICGALAAAALVLYFTLQDPNITVFFAVFSGTLASVPTLIKCYKYAETESGLVYVLGCVNQITGFIAMKTWSFSEAALGIDIFALDLLLALLVYRKKLRRKP